MSKPAIIEGEIEAPKAVAKRKETAPMLSEGAALIQMIERVALNPNADIDKLERLLNMQERMMAQRAKSAYTAALAAMQPELPVISERGKIEIGKGKPQTYALWEDINEKIKPVLAKHGFALSFRTGRDADKIIVTAVLGHRDGHTEDTTMHLPIDASGSKNAVQAVGSSTSYGKRYTASALLNLTSRGEDDDGNKAGAGPVIDDKQVQTIKNMIKSTKSNADKFCQYMTQIAGMKIGSVEEIPDSKFQAAIDALEAKMRAQL